MFIIEYYIVLKKKEIMVFMIIYIDFLGVMYSEIRQIQKNKYRIGLFWCRILRCLIYKIRVQNDGFQMQEEKEIWRNDVI